MLRAIALALAFLLLSSACGHYGPPVRGEAPAAEKTPGDKEEETEESESDRRLR